jgi:hypothetical protein
LPGFDESILATAISIACIALYFREFSLCLERALKAWRWLHVTKFCATGVLIAIMAATSGCGSSSESGSGGSGGSGGSSNANEWIWVSGSNSSGQNGVYGNLGTTAAANTPGARAWASSWVDPSGSFWLFGGICVGPASYAAEEGNCNDLWRYKAGEWTWMSGSQGFDAPAVYGTIGTPSPANTPSARYGAARWTDTSGNLWLFGGDVGVGVNFDTDLWKFSDGQWTLVAQPANYFQGGTCGTQGVAAPANYPGGRAYATTWTDSAGNFWMFGGFGYDCGDSPTMLNELWKFDGSQWTLVTAATQFNETNGMFGGVYGSKGVAAAGNMPPGRELATGWVDPSGAFWIFGGTPDGNDGYNDLWKFSGGQWTWVSGSNSLDAYSSYGTKGSPAASNVPGARYGASGWADGSGNLWLFGGTEYFLDSIPPSGSTSSPVNDLWKFSGDQWSWVSGSNSGSLEPPVYGTLGQPSSSNDPGSRWAATNWTDAAGNFWLYGGESNYQVLSNDLWEYKP